MRSPWILETPSRKPGRCRLLCFPYAGGGASLFTGWSANLGPAAEVLPIQLPGRENRLREPPFTDVDALVRSLLQSIGPQLYGPWAVFGHSFGGLLAYETARAAVRDGYQQPQAVFVSACRPPDVETRFAHTLHTMGDEDLIAELQELGEAPMTALNDPDLRRLFIPTIRADVELCETYRFVSDDVLEAPIVALSGADDPHADAVEMKRWAEFTHGPFVQEIVDGGHFFLRSNPESLLHHLKEHLEAPPAGVH